ncbi:CopG family transcriptional regulator [Sulfurospirillum sp. 1307]|jgi:predicted DNA-binding protein
MTATVRLDKHLEDKLKMLVKTLNKKKSDVIREAIEAYANNVNKTKEKRMLDAVERTKRVDEKESVLLEGTLDDGF